MLPCTAKLLSTLAVQNPHGLFTLQHGIIIYKGRIWVSGNRSMKFKILESLHSSPLGGHSGFPVTYRRIKNLFTWPGQKGRIIKQFVAQCSICQQAKSERVKYPCLLQPFLQHLCLENGLFGLHWRFAKISKLQLHSSEVFKVCTLDPS